MPIPNRIWKRTLGLVCTLLFTYIIWVYFAYLARSNPKAWSDTIGKWFRISHASAAVEVYVIPAIYVLLEIIKQAFFVFLGLTFSGGCMEVGDFLQDHNITYSGSLIDLKPNGILVLPCPNPMDTREKQLTVECVDSTFWGLTPEVLQVNNTACTSISHCVDPSNVLTQTFNFPSTVVELNNTVSTTWRAGHSIRVQCGSHDFGATCVQLDSGFSEWLFERSDVCGGEKETARHDVKDEEKVFAELFDNPQAYSVTVNSVGEQTYIPKKPPYSSSFRCSPSIVTLLGICVVFTFIF
eukprot:198104_1